MIFIAASHETVIDTRSMTRKPIIVGILRRGRSGTSQGSNPVGLCCSSTLLVKCGPDEPRWSWTQNLGQASMPAYSLNWTARSVLYKRDKGVNVAARPPEGGPAEAGDLSASNLPLISIPHPARMPDDTAKAR